MMARTPLRALVEGGHRLISRLTSTSPGMPSIGTHNGKFHCDEVLACFMLKSLPQFTHYDIIRTRDPSALSNCSIVVDVGGVYDHEKLRYDHHQRDFNDTMKTLNVLDFETKLSSAGLIYAHYGRRVIAELLKLRDDSTEVNILYKKVYEAFVEAVDAIDNGIPQFDGIPRYHLGGTLSNRVGNLNPAWNDEDIDVEKRFHEAMKLVGAEFLDRLRYFHRSWLPARELVAECVENRFDIDKSGQILALDKGGVPWKEHFFTLEKEHNLLNAQITYIVFADTTSDDWRVQAIPLDEKATFENRLPLPETWRGYRNGELSKLTGIPNCVFTHMTGFIGGNRTRDGAVEMARRSLQIAGKYLDYTTSRCSNHRCLFCAQRDKSGECS
uniref:Regulator of microtubule dynamics protein 1 n=1 Tax=Parascaris univalens TaxID=6257 RepID=A0A915B2C2_PARUN